MAPGEISDSHTSGTENFQCEKMNIKTEEGVNVTVRKLSDTCEDDSFMSLDTDVTDSVGMKAEVGRDVKKEMEESNDAEGGGVNKEMADNMTLSMEVFEEPDGDDSCEDPNFTCIKTEDCKRTPPLTYQPGYRTKSEHSVLESVGHFGTSPSRPIIKSEPVDFDEVQDEAEYEPPQETGAIKLEPQESNLPATDFGCVPENQGLLKIEVEDPIHCPVEGSEYLQGESQQPMYPFHTPQVQQNEDMADQGPVTGLEGIHSRVDTIPNISAKTLLRRNILNRIAGAACNKQDSDRSQPVLFGNNPTEGTSSCKNYDSEETFRQNTGIFSPELTITKDETLPCYYCARRFSTKSQLLAHECVRAGDKPFICGHCGKVFLRKRCLTIHERIHTGDKCYKCDICGKAFSKSSSLIEHERIHTGDKPFKCGHCDKAFSRNSVLIAHERCHTGDNLFQCGSCDKAFSQKGALTVHERSHTGDKPFKCVYCDKAFMRKGCLLLHERVHTGDKPFRCGYCGKAFLRKNNLTLHQRVHTGDKPFKCDTCGKVFADSSINAVAHQRMHTRSMQS